MPLSFPAFILSSLSSGNACTVQHNRANVIPRTKRDGVARGIGDSANSLFRNVDLHEFFPLEKFGIWYQNVQYIPAFFNVPQHLRKTYSLTLSRPRGSP